MRQFSISQKSEDDSQIMWIVNFEGKRTHFVMSRESISNLNEINIDALREAVTVLKKEYKDIVPDITIEELAQLDNLITH